LLLVVDVQSDFCPGGAVADGDAAAPIAAAVEASGDWI
jgi:nicotinamidase-related amidase